jgi:hypothetical protein
MPFSTEFKVSTQFPALRIKKGEAVRNGASLHPAAAPSFVGAELGKAKAVETATLHVLAFGSNPWRDLIRIQRPCERHGPRLSAEARRRRRR